MEDQLLPASGSSHRIAAKPTEANFTPDPWCFRMTTFDFIGLKSLFLFFLASCENPEGKNGKEKSVMAF